MDITMDDVRREVVNYVKSDEFKSVIQNQYRDLLTPTIRGCSISYDMSAVKTGKSTAWSNVYVTYDNGGYRAASDQNSIVIPNGLSGVYLVLADVTITPAGASPATSMDMSINGYSTNEITGLGGSSILFDSNKKAPLQWSSNNFLPLNEGDVIYLSGGSFSTTEQWTCPVLQNHISVIKFPFGS
jgi:hypothetical protein